MRGSKQKSFLIKFSSANRKRSMETLVGGTKPVAIGIYEFESRNTTKKFNTPQVFDCGDYDGRITNIGFSTECSSTRVKLLIVSLMEKIKLIVVEK